jgi:hypothetical protein
MVAYRPTMSPLTTATKNRHALLAPGEARSESRVEGLPVTTTKDFLLTHLRCTRNAVSVGRSRRRERAAPLLRRLHAGHLDVGLDREHVVRAREQEGFAKSASELVNTRSQLESSPGAASGSVTCEKVCHLDALRSSDGVLQRRVDRLQHPLHRQKRDGGTCLSSARARARRGRRY